MGKSTNYMAMFNSYVSHYQAGYIAVPPGLVVDGTHRESMESFPPPQKKTTSVNPQCILNWSEFLPSFSLVKLN